MLKNSRFYILVSSVLLSIIIFSWLRLEIAADQLFYIRSQQVFGLLCLLYWYLALVISPVGYIIGKQRIKHLEFARRAIGVSAFYFALLHAAVALWGQLGGPGQLQYLPNIFQWSLIGGAGAVIVLFLMAITSFDVVIRFMTFRKWKWLHRLVYIAGVLAILHVWTIGTHLAYDGVKIAALVALVILIGLELYKTISLINKNYLHLNKTEVATLFVSVWIIVSMGVAALPFFIQNYHSRHANHDTSSHNQGIKQ